MTKRIDELTIPELQFIVAHYLLKLESCRCEDCSTPIALKFTATCTGCGTVLRDETVETKPVELWEETAA